MKLMPPPDGVHETAKEWFEQSGAGSGGDYQEVYPAETVCPPQPKGPFAFRWPAEFRYRPAYVAVMPEGRIWGGAPMHSEVWSGEVVTPDNKLLKDAGFPEWWNLPVRSPLPPVADFEETLAVLVSPLQYNYYHWLIDILPRLHLLEESGLLIDKYVFGILPLRYQLDTLSMLGIPESRIVQIGDNQFHCRAAKLVVPALPARLGICPKWACDYVRSRLLPAHLPKSGEYARIYISRDDSPKRKVINEDEVLQVLGAKGFKKVVLGPLPFEEQVRIFHSAEWVVSPHGAGLANLVFCGPGTKVVELLARNSATSTHFWILSHHMRLDYYNLACDAQYPPKEAPQLDDIVVDIAKLLQTLDCAGQPPTDFVE